VTDKFFTRDHTERMLGLKSELRNNEKIIFASQKNYPQPNSYFVPSDISTAAFFIVLALLSKNAELKIPSVSLNETRTGLLELLTEMGGKIEFNNQQENNGEIFGDIIVKNSNLQNITIKSEIIPNIIDEIPILAVASWFSTGHFIIKNASELRKKETDRIKSLCWNFKLLGLDVEEFEDGFSVSGENTNQEPLFESFNDHRIAMAFAVLSLLLKTGGKVKNFDSAAISNPNFIPQVKSIVK
jgi:3-phosphoshikimate 1-carboxyvinyltransferase